MAKSCDAVKERYWRDVFQRQGASGLGVRQFCVQEGLPEHRFHWWRRTFRQRGIQDGSVARGNRRPQGSQGLPARSVRGAIAETQDEKMYRIVMDRERWFSVVMGENYTLDMRTTETLANRVPFPVAAASELAFRLGIANDSE